MRPSPRATTCAITRSIAAAGAEPDELARVLAIDPGLEDQAPGRLDQVARATIGLAPCRVGQGHPGGAWDILVMEQQLGDLQHLQSLRPHSLLSSDFLFESLCP